MICILSPNEKAAANWADNQGLSRSEWFYGDEERIKGRINFHVIVIGMFPDERLGWFEKVYHLAKSRGQIGRT